MNINIIIVLSGVAVIVALLAAVAFLAMKKKQAARRVSEVEEESRTILAKAAEDADKIKREAAISAKEKELNRQADFENQTREARKKINETERRLINKEENLERRFQAIERKEREFSQKERRLFDKEKELETLEGRIGETIKKEMTELERISGLTQEEAKGMLIRKIEDAARLEAIQTVRRIEEEAKEKGQGLAREVIVNAIQRSAAEHVVETTVSVVALT